MQGDVGLNLYDFYVRTPNKPTAKYILRAYDDVILAPYVRSLALRMPREVLLTWILFRRRSSLPEWLNSTRRSPRRLSSSGPRTSKTSSTSAATQSSVSLSRASPFRELTPLPPRQTTAMRNSTKHLLPPSPLLPPPSDTLLPDPAAQDNSTTPRIGSPAAAAPHPVTPAAAVPTAPVPTIDVRYEAGKIPLDVAVVESILAAGTEDRMKRVCANVLIVGGTGAIHNIGFAVESRLVTLPSLSPFLPEFFR